MRRASLSKPQRVLLFCALATVAALAAGLVWWQGRNTRASARVVASGAVSAQPAPSRTEAAPPSRAELVAAADCAGLAATRAAPDQAARLLARAAELRIESYVREGREVDALEARELWAQAEAAAGATSCDEALRLLELRARLAPDPRAHYRELYLLLLRQDSVSCRQRVERALATLAAFAPSAEELAALRESARAQAAPSARHGQDEHGHVVVPELRAGLERPTTITRVEPFGAEQTARVVVHVTHPTRFQVGLLEPVEGRGPRLFVDIQHARFEGPPVYETEGLVERVRLGEHQGATRVVLDLRAVAFHRVFYLPDPFRLVLDLSIRPPDQLTKPREIRRVVLDPGHGGTDPGAVGPNGLREKDVTLDVAHRAAPLLAREVGVSTLLTRDVDVFVPLDVRAAKANAFHGDLFVSIHCNSSEDSAARGVMTFVLDASRDEAAAKVAARENSSTAAAAAELANSLSRIESADRRAASELFAGLLQRAAGASLRQAYPTIEDHGVRRAGFYVLAGAAMPAVLFESSFISNPTEAERLDSDAYRQRLADSIVNAVRAYRQGL